MTTAMRAGMAVCHICLAGNTLQRRRCRRCHGVLHARIPYSLQRTAALSAAAAILYLPANLLPILTTHQFGRIMDNTIIGGVVNLLQQGSYPVAIVILVASVLIPLGKIAALTLLCWAAVRGRGAMAHHRTILYRITDFVGKWSMVDVFVVAILVGLIQIGGIMTVRPGAAALAFAGVVITTMLAAESFDPRLIWDQEGHSRE
ncbi:MAG: paraquat-inducible protein A [Gammaproteobacteria bacterium]|nr:paraquat-inducible protein A [Gammaproteobacteria bacterium]